MKNDHISTIDIEYIIADTSGIVSLININDSNHHIAVRNAEILKRECYFLVPSDVLSETINIISKKINKIVAIKTFNVLLNDVSFIIKGNNQEIMKNAFQKFKTISNSTSFTDCIVMAFADYYQSDNKYIFGFDKIFKKKGYNIIE